MLSQILSKAGKGCVVPREALDDVLASLGMSLESLVEQAQVKAGQEEQDATLLSAKEDKLRKTAEQNYAEAVRLAETARAKAMEEVTAVAAEAQTHADRFNQLRKSLQHFCNGSKNGKTTG